MLTIDAPPEQKKGRGMEAPAQGVGFRIDRNNDNSDPASQNQTNSGVADAVWLTRLARNALQRAVFRLGDDGFECAALNDRYGDVALLVCDWAGRRRPLNLQPLPDWVTAAAIEWRRRNGRSC